MFSSIRNPLVAALLSLSLAIGAVGASATPARADNNEAAAVIGGLIALYAIGRALENNRDRHVAPPRHQPIQIVPHPRSRIAPAHCFIEGQDRNGYFRGYVRRCMQNSVSAPDLLPHACLRQVHTPRGERHIYGGRCLFQNGWTRG